MSQQFIVVLANMDATAPYFSDRGRPIASNSNTYNHKGVFVGPLDEAYKRAAAIHAIYPMIDYRPVRLSSSICKKIRASGLSAKLTDEEIKQGSVK